ncbi:uncharacterized protein LOC106177970 [Lingula anatina]|uniref:Uncharacterized protein LOC106177970 n=1 Tax=Lingula anatina TaxID=7574 RepID=A0A1S3K1H4_LINAN|nr:uncharacterized protein LOC106177970 [Lingula anatina]|eukprot:XP_013416382.1 uncharacterized protein LOC106177970 [Lingula anatina]
MALNSLAKLMEMIESHSTKLQFPSTGNFKYNYVRKRLFAIFQETHIRKLRGMLSWTKSDTVEVVVFGEHAAGLASQIESEGFKIVKALKPEKDIPRLFIFAPEIFPTKEDVELLQLVLNQTNNEACSLVAVALTTDVISRKGRLVTKEDIVKEILLEWPAGHVILTKALDAISSDILFWNNERDITEKVFLYMMEAVDNAMTDFLKVVQNLIAGLEYVLEEKCNLESKIQQYLHSNREKIDQCATTLVLKDHRGGLIHRRRSYFVQNKETLANFTMQITKKLTEMMGIDLIHLSGESQCGAEAKLNMEKVMASFMKHIPKPGPWLYPSLPQPVYVNGESFRKMVALDFHNDVTKQSDNITRTLLSFIYQSDPDDDDDRPKAEDFEKLRILHLEMNKLTSKIKIYRNPHAASLRQVPIIPDPVKAELHKKPFIRAFGIIFGKLHIFVQADLWRQEEEKRLIKSEIERIVSDDEFCQYFCIVEWSPNSKITPYGFGVGSMLSMRQDRNPPFGTLGCFAFVDGVVREVYALTCEHVARKCKFVENENGFLQVGQIAYSKPAQSVVSQVDIPPSDLVDIAFIRLSAEARRAYEGVFMVRGEPHDCRLFTDGLESLHGERVHKNGAATGYTEGIVVGTLHMNGMFQRFSNLLLVKSVGNKPFSLDGDSGSVVVMKSDCAPNSLLAVSMIYGGLDIRDGPMTKESKVSVTFGLCKAITDAEFQLQRRFRLQPSP